MANIQITIASSPFPLNRLLLLTNYTYNAQVKQTGQNRYFEMSGNTFPFLPNLFCMIKTFCHTWVPKHKTIYIPLLTHITIYTIIHHNIRVEHSMAQLQYSYQVIHCQFQSSAKHFTIKIYFYFISFLIPIKIFIIQSFILIFYLYLPS